MTRLDRLERAQTYILRAAQDYAIGGKHHANDLLAKAVSELQLTIREK